VIKTLDKFPLFGPAGNDWIQGRMQDQFGLLERGLLIAGRLKNLFAIMSNTLLRLGIEQVEEKYEKTREAVVAKVT
jgi:hypothetical protein